MFDNVVESLCSHLALFGTIRGRSRFTLFVFITVSCSCWFRFFVRFNSVTLESQPNEESYHEILFDLYHRITPLNPIKIRVLFPTIPRLMWPAKESGKAVVRVIYSRPILTHGIWHVYEYLKNTKDKISTHCLLMFISFLNNLR